MSKIQENYSGNVSFKISANGDYCDQYIRYLFESMNTFSNAAACKVFVEKTKNTMGGDAPEAYEFALKRIREYPDWDNSASKLIIFIADDLPHGVNYPDNTEKIDWKIEVRKLADMGVQIYPVQCLRRSYADKFYSEMAEVTGGIHLELDQFREIEHIISAVGIQQEGVEAIQNYRQELVDSQGLTRSVNRTLNRLEGIEENLIPENAGFGRISEDLVPICSGTYQVMLVDDSQKWSIKKFVESNNVPYIKAQGFYEFLKASEKIQPSKEVILQHKLSGDMFSGRKARELIGLDPDGGSGIETVKKVNLPVEYKVFVQSTSYNRVLVGNSEFLYKVGDT